MPESSHFLGKNFKVSNSTRGHDTFTSDCHYSNFHLASTWQIYDEFPEKNFHSFQMRRRRSNFYPYFQKMRRQS